MTRYNDVAANCAETRRRRTGAETWANATKSERRARARRAVARAKLLNYEQAATTGEPWWRRYQHQHTETECYRRKRRGAVVANFIGDGVNDGRTMVAHGRGSEPGVALATVTNQLRAKKTGKNGGGKKKKDLDNGRTQLTWYAGAINGGGQAWAGGGQADAGMRRTSGGWAADDPQTSVPYR